MYARSLVASALSLLLAGASFTACFSKSSGGGPSAGFDAGLGGDTFSGSSSGGSSGSSGGGDAGPGADATTDAAPPEASAADTTVPDASADVLEEALVDAGAIEGSCNSLTLAGTPLVNAAVSTEATAPAQTGGVITDGTYFLTAATEYGGATDGPSGVMFQGIWVISGGVTLLEEVFPSVVEVPDSAVFAEAGIVVATGLPGSASGTDILVQPEAGATAVTHIATCRGGVQFQPSSSTWAYSVTGGGQTLSVIPDSNSLFLATFTKQ